MRLFLQAWTQGETNLLLMVVTTHKKRAQKLVENFQPKSESSSIQARQVEDMEEINLTREAVYIISHED